MARLQSLVIAALALVVPMSCTPCDRSGCEAIARRASPSIPQGVAGSVALLSDVVANGCQECRLSKTDLRLWQRAMPVIDADTARIVQHNEPPMVVSADGRFAVALPVGRNFLFCLGRPESSEGQPCAAFTVEAQKVTTINAKLVFGPSTLLVFDPGATSPRPETVDFSPAP
jgi:hypothetical protein